MTTSNNGHSNGQAPMPSGGAGCALDMSDERDRAMVRRAVADWPARMRSMNPERRDRLVDDLFEILDEAKGIEDLTERCRVRESCVRTGVAMVKVQQADDHKLLDKVAADKHDHEHSGQVDHRVVAIVPDRDG